MPARITVFDRQSKTRTEYLCDEDNTARMIEADVESAAEGKYQDAAGQAFQVDWTCCRIINFARQKP